ncbi:hypothetical protein GE061_010750 [Apolygus lucorum]|uniref:Uncharacterized protein n=1 Tax=Apolygus lucorum TaxID=248454 RepID=A0A6A4JZH3_APOLU|nr:hypothetical protein GE061_010750 [Apolygus lucorum]
MMLGQLVQRLQTLSPVTSPLASPKVKRRPAKSLAARRSLKEEYREIQSEPEDAPGSEKKPKSKRRIDKLRNRRLEVSAPLQGSKSMGRLDGLKQTSLLRSEKLPQ